MRLIDANLSDLHRARNDPSTSFLYSRQQVGALLFDVRGMLQLVLRYRGVDRLGDGGEQAGQLVGRKAFHQLPHRRGVAHSEKALVEPDALPDLLQGYWRWLVSRQRLQASLHDLIEQFEPQQVLRVANV